MPSDSGQRPDIAAGFSQPRQKSVPEIEKSPLKKQHKGVFKTLNEEAEKNDDKPVRPFVLYYLPSWSLAVTQNANPIAATTIPITCRASHAQPYSTMAAANPRRTVWF